MKLQEKLKTALDETRLLILGAQIVFGFHLNGVFQDAFDKLSSTAKATHAVAFVLMVLTIGLLIAPSMQHRLIERGEATGRIHRAATLCATSALLPFGASLALDLSIVIQHQFNQGLAVPIGATFFALAMTSFGTCWSGGKSAENYWRRPWPKKAKKHLCMRRWSRC